MSSLTSSLLVPFGSGSGEGVLTLENYQSVFVGLGSLALALHDTIPTGSVQLFTTAGTVADVNLVVQKKVKAAFVQMSNSSTLEIPNGVAYTVLFAIDSNGVPLDVVEVSRSATEAKFSQPFYGLVKVAEHTIDVRILKYTPSQTTIQNLVSTAFGVSVTYGTVAAFKDGRLATCEVEPPTVSNGADELEVYRIESQSLINPEGEWEMPDGWPDNPTYPTGATPPRPRIGVVTTRVHEVGMVTSEGYFYSREFDVAIAKPYFGNVTAYTPTKSVVQGSGFSKLTDAMKIKAQEAMTARGKGQYI